jgi:rhamnose utilization protein RhaD (predicted bifunctional aldolase and dehydrogenase)
MTTEWNPAVVSDDLLALTRRLGEPELDLVILAEGNTSELIEDDRIVVKSSGSYMSTATTNDFVTVSVSEVVGMIEDPSSTQAELTEVLNAGVHDGVRRRGSIETLVHASVRHYTSARYVAHTHPTPVISLLASVHAKEAFETAAYSDEVVVIGSPLFVPYAPPGIELGRLFHSLLGEHVAEHGSVPPLILLGNHGVVATSDTALGAEAISLMSVKAARVRIGAYSVGGVAGLDAEHVAAYWSREDFTERRDSLSGSNQ